MTFALPAAVPAITNLPDFSLACWKSNDGGGRCYAKAISDLGLCREHRDELHDEDA